MLELAGSPGPQDPVLVYFSCIAVNGEKHSNQQPGGSEAEVTPWAGPKQKPAPRQSWLSEFSVLSRLTSTQVDSAGQGRLPSKQDGTRRP